MNLGLRNQHPLIHSSSHPLEALEMHVSFLLQQLMDIASILPMVLSYFELDGYRDLKGRSSACAMGKHPISSKHRPLNSFIYGKLENPESIPLKQLLTSTSCSEASVIWFAPSQPPLCQGIRDFISSHLCKPGKVHRDGPFQLFPLPLLVLWK